MSDIFIKAQGNKIPVPNYLFYLTHSRRSDYITNENENIELQTDNRLHFQNYNIIKYTIDFFKKRKREPVFDPNKFTEIVVALPKDISEELLAYKDTFHNIVNQYFERYFFKEQKGEHFLNFLHTKDKTGIKLHTHVLLYPFTTINGERVHIKHFKPHQELEELKEELREFIKKPDTFKPIIKGIKYRFDKKSAYTIKNNFLNKENNIEAITKDLLRKLEEEIRANGILQLKNLSDIYIILDIFKRNYYLARKNNALLSILLHYCNNVDILKQTIEIFENVNPKSEINNFILTNATERLKELQNTQQQNLKTTKTFSI